MTRRAAGELEAEVLTALWAADAPMTAAEVQEQLDAGLAATTVITILNRLVEKGLVDRSRPPGERALRFAPTRERAEHAAEQMYAYLETDADPGEVLARFVGRLSASERRAVLDVLDRRAR